MALSILMFCPQFRPLVGGAERQAEKLAAALNEEGCHVTILTPHINPASPAIEETNGVRIERFPLIDLACHYPVPGVAVLNIPYILWQVAQAVRPHLKSVDIVHAHIASLQTVGAALAGHIAKVPVICKAAMADHKSDIGEIEKTGPSGYLVAWLARKFIQNWVATTVAVEQALFRAGVKPTNVFRIPNGVDLASDILPYKATGRIRRFLYLGRLSTNTERDLPGLINAFDNVAKTREDMELALVGSGDLFEETRRLVEACSSRDRIHLPGFDEPNKWLIWADCFVLPSRREGLSNALLEAMAAGIPCIASDILPNREVLGNGEAGMLVPVEDPGALEEAMCSLIETAGLAETYSRKGKERVEKCYSIRAVAQNHISLYRKLCHGNSKA